MGKVTEKKTGKTTGQPNTWSTRGLRPINFNSEFLTSSMFNPILGKT